MAESASVPTARKRSGSEKRQRGKGAILVRLLPDERAAIETKASVAGLSLGSFLRASGLGNPGPRARRSPPINAEGLAHAVAALNKAGSNLNQIAKTLNSAQAVGSREAVEALNETRAAVGRILELVGRTDRE